MTHGYTVAIDASAWKDDAFFKCVDVVDQLGFNS